MRRNCTAGSLALLFAFAPAALAQVPEETIASISTPETVETRIGTLTYESGYPSSGTSTFQVCGGAAVPGQWTLTATLNYEIGDNAYSTELPQAHFDMRLPTTRTTLRASDRTLRHYQAFKFSIKT